MKVLQVIQRPQLRGAEMFACQLSMELIRKGVQVDVVYLFEHENLLPFDLRFIPLKANASKRFWDFDAYRRLNDIIRTGRYDIVQSNAGDTLKYAALSKLFYRWKTPLVYRNANKISDFLTSRSKVLLNKLFVGQVDHVISVSHLCRDDFSKTFNLPEKKIDTVQIGIDMQPSAPFPKDLSLIADGGPVLLNVGSFVKEKNQLGLLNIFKDVLKHVPAAKLILVGKGKLEDAVSTRIEALGLGNNVYRLGHRTDVQAIMNGSQVFMLPSLIEGLPAVVLEAQYNRVPVVSYDVGGIPEVILSGETGWLIPKDDERGFAQAVVECLADRAGHREAIVQRAYDQVTKHYDNTIIAERFYQVYRKIETSHT